MKDINLFKLKDSVYLKKVKSKAEVSRDCDCDGFLIESSEKEARRIVESLKGSLTRNSVPSKKGTKVPASSGMKIGVVGGDDAFNRRVVETLRIDYLVSAERSSGKDSLKQRDSGLNHVVAKIAKDKGVMIVVDMGEVMGLKGKEKTLRLGRVIQNVKVARKVGCSIGIASLGSKKKDIVDELGRKAFGISLGMSSLQNRDCVKF